MTRTRAPARQLAAGRTRRSRIAEPLMFLVAAMWLYAAVMKLASIAASQTTLAQHAVFPASLVVGLSWIVPIIECICAVAIVTLTGKPGLRGILGCSFGLLLLCGFAVYIVSVPAPVLEASGCGCMGGTVERWVGGITGSARAASIAIVATFASLHVATIWAAIRRPHGTVEQSPAH